MHLGSEASASLQKLERVLKGSESMISIFRRLLR